MVQIRAEFRDVADSRALSLPDAFAAVCGPVGTRRTPADRFGPRAGRHFCLEKSRVTRLGSDNLTLESRRQMLKRGTRVVIHALATGAEHPTHTLPWTIQPEIAIQNIVEAVAIKAVPH